MSKAVKPSSLFSSRVIPLLQAKRTSLKRPEEQAEQKSFICFAVAFLEAFTEAGPVCDVAVSATAAATAVGALQMSL
jgi:hypothetical protein